MSLPVKDFQKEIYSYYHSLNQSYPWRETRDPYHILVSEFMLQQTQTSRVIPKYIEFLQKFPDIHTLAESPTKSVLEYWQGLGYNRRALYLHQTAHILARDFQGNVPRKKETLLELPGIGPYTAPAIATFAYNKPEVFIETNIRSVFIHHFFEDSDDISDSQIIPLVERTLDRPNPREWYYALMDYGVMIKKTRGNPNKRSKHYTKQSTFEGSRRQKRGQVIRQLTKRSSLSMSELRKALDTTDEALEDVLTSLENEGFITRERSSVSLTS